MRRRGSAYRVFAPALASRKGQPESTRAGDLGIHLRLLLPLLLRRLRGLRHVEDDWTGSSPTMAIELCTDAFTPIDRGVPWCAVLFITIVLLRLALTSSTRAGAAVGLVGPARWLQTVHCCSRS